MRMSAKLLEEIFLISLLLMFPPDFVTGHGRLVDPPARSTAWRYGYDTPVNYDDNQLYCGGKQIQWEVNGGKCGICGDPWNGKREHETPDGKYAQNPLRITGHYASESVLEARVELTTSHLGFFTFRLCPETSDEREVTQSCLDRYLLKWLQRNGSTQDKYPIHSEGTLENSSRFFVIPLRLPSNVTCDRCVLQWTYTAGNSWGDCPDGSKETGCGPQETFRGCADIKIYDRRLLTQSKEIDIDVSDNEIETSPVGGQKRRTSRKRKRMTSL